MLEQRRASTFHAHAQAQADEVNQGRFRSIGVPNVIGSTPSPSSQYPAASAAHQTKLPPEPPLGFNNPALDDPAGVVTASADPSMAAPVSIEAGGAAAPSSSVLPDVEPAPPSSPNNRNE